MTLPRRPALSRASLMVAAALLSGGIGSVSTATAANLFWDVNADAAGAGGAGNWDTASAYWFNAGAATTAAGTDPTAAFVFSSADTAYFTGTAGAVSLQQPVTVGGLYFGSAGYALSGSTLTLAAGATVNASADVTISSNLSASGFTKSGAGTLTLSGANVSSGTIAVSAGTLKAGAVGTFASGAIFSVLSGATLDTDAFSQSIFGLSGAGEVKLGAGATLRVGGTVALSNESATAFSGLLSGAGSLQVTGGSLTLSNAANTYSGATTISGGILVVTDPGALGTSNSLITVFSGGTNRATQGGQLVVGSVAGTPLTFTRSLLLYGRGPVADGSALLTVGGNTFSGPVFTSSLAENRIAAFGGITTFSGPITINALSSTNNFLYVTGSGSMVISGAISGGNYANSSSFNRAGSGTTILTGTNLNVGRWQVDAGSIRVGTGANLGTTTRADGLIPNGGFIEIRTDAGNTFSTLNFQLNNASTGLVLDRAVAGTGSLGQTVSMAAGLQANNLNSSGIAGRNGVNLLLSTFKINGTANTSVTSTKLNGVLQIGALTYVGGGTSQTDQLNAYGDVVVTGNFSASGGTTPVYAFNSQSNSRGLVTLLGTSTTGSVGIRISDGALAVATSAAFDTGGFLLGSSTYSGGLIYLGAGGGALYGGTGAGETWAKTITLNTSATSFIFANQAGSAASALNINGTFTTTAATTNALYFGGSNTSDNTMTSVIANGTGAYNVGKTGTGTWVFAGNNTYTGTTSIYGGTLKFTNATTTTLTGGLTFQADTASSASGGWTGAQTAGGSFQYNAASGSLTMGALTVSAGAANVQVGAATTLKFASLARSAGATLNFDQGTGGIQFATTAPTLTGTTGPVIFGSYLTTRSAGVITAVELATVGAVNTSIGAAAYAALGAGATVGTTTYSVTGSPTTGQADAVNALKIIGAAGGNTLTLGGNLTFGATADGLILFDNTAGVASIAGAFSVGSAAKELVIITAGNGPGNALSFGASTTIGATSGTLTKSGSGALVLQASSAAFTGNTVINEGKITLSGATANMLGAPAVGGTLTLRQTATLDLGGSGVSAVPYGTAAALPTTVVGALVGGGMNAPVAVLNTTANGAVTNANTITLASATGVQVGQTVTSPTIGGYPTVTAVNGLVVTLSAPVTIANGVALAFSKNVTTGATITNSGAAAAVSFGLAAGTSTAPSAYAGVIQDGAGATTVIVTGTSARIQTLAGFNTYTGATIIGGSATILANNLANGGVASSIGASSNAAANLVFNGGTLKYTGAGATVFQSTQTPSIAIDRLFTLAGNGAIDSSGTSGSNYLGGTIDNSAALVFANPGAISYANTTAAARTLTLTGTSLGDNEIDLQLVNNASTTNSLGITKAGASLWILGNATNSYTGLTTISAGQLRAVDGASLPTNSPLVLAGGVLETSGSFTRSLAATLPTATSANGGVFWNAAGGGFAASTGRLTVLLNNSNASPLVWGSTAGFVPAGQALILGSATALFDVDFQNSLNLNGAARSVTVNDNANTYNDFATLSGVISDSVGGGGLVISANAPLVLTGANTYPGTTNIATGEVRVFSLGNSVTSPGAATNVGAASAATTAAVVFGNTTTTGGTLVYLGAGETSDRALASYSTTGGITIDASGTGPLVLTGTFTNSNAAASAKTLTLNGFNAGVNILASTLTNNTGAGGGALSITKNGGGLWVITGNNTGVSGGSVSLAGGVLGVGHNSALGTDSISWSNGMLMAYGGDRTLANAVTLNANTTWGAVGNYSLTFTSLTNWGSGTTTYSNSFYNNLVGGKAVTFGGGFNSSFGNTGTNTITFVGPGATVITGAITQTAGSAYSNAIAYQGTPGGSFTFNGAGTNTMVGAFTQTSGTVNVARVGAFAAFSNFTFSSGYLQNTYGSALTGANALIPVTTTVLGTPGALNISGATAFLVGSGAAASVEVAGQFNNGGAGNRTLYVNLTSGASLVLSGSVNLSSDATNRAFTVNGLGTGLINLTGVIGPSYAAASTATGGTLIKGALGDLNLAPTSSLNSPTVGNLVLTGGTATFSTASTQSFSLLKFDVAGNAALNLNYDLNNVTTSVGLNGASYRAINLLGGALNFTANSLSGTAESVGALQMGFGSSNVPFSTTGQGAVNFVNAGSSASSLSFALLGQVGTGGLVNLAVPSLGSVNKVYLPGLLTNAAYGANARVIVNGADYATTGANGLVAYAGYVAGNNLAAMGFLPTQPGVDSFNLSASPTFTGATIAGWSRTAFNLKVSGNNVDIGASAPLFQLTLAGGGLLVTGTGANLSVPVLSLGAEGFFNVASGASLTVSDAVIGGVPFNKAGAGSLLLAGKSYWTSSTMVSGGTLKVAADNAFPNFPTATTPTLQNLHVNYGGALDLNGTTQFVANLNDNNGLQGSSGAIVNTSTSPAVLHFNAGNATFGGTIAGAISLFKYANSTQLFTNNLTYTGSTNIIGNTIELIDAGRLTGTSAVNVSFGGTFWMANSGNQDRSDRIPVGVPISLKGGILRFDGATSVISTQTVGAVSLAAGANSVAANTTANGGAFLTLSSLSRSPGALLNFTGTNLGQLYNGSQNGRILIAGQADGLIGGWATLGGTEFATYLNAVDATTSPAVSMGVTALQTYVTAADSAWTSGDNVKLVNNAAAPVYTLGGARTINTLNLQSTTTALTVNNTALTLVSGGLLSSGAAGNTLAGGTLTAGSGAAAELFVLDNNNTTITSQIVDNGAGAVTLVKGLGGTTTLSPTVSNTYTGGTVVDAGTLSVGSAAGIVAIPGALTVNNAAVTFTQLQQIASGKSLTINGAGGSVTFAGTGINVLGAVSFLNNGAFTTPQVTGGTVAMASLSAQNDNLSATPTVASTVDLNGAALTITTSGLSVMDLIVSGAVVDSTASLSTGLVKAGPGSLVLSATGSTFGGGVALNAGTLIVEASSTPTSGVVTSGPLGTGALTMAAGTTLMGGTAVRTLANTVTLGGDVFLAGPVSGNNISLAGVLALGSSARTVTVLSPNATATLSGTVTGTQPLTKAGLGVLALSGSTVTYAPGFALNAGTIQLDQTVSSFSAGIVTAAATTVSLNPGANGSIGVSVNPGATPFAISGSGQLIKPGATNTAYVLNVYGNFTYTGPTTVQSGSLLLTPNALTNAAPTLAGTSMVNIGSPGQNTSNTGISFGLDNAGATGVISVGSGAIPVNFIGRDSVVTTIRNADFGSNLNLNGAVNRLPGATGIFSFVNNVGFQPSPDDSVMTSNRITVAGSAGVINPGVYVTSGNLGNTIVRTDFAFRDAAGFVRNVSYGVDAGTTLGSSTMAVAAAGGNLKVTAPVVAGSLLSSTAAPNTLFLAGQQSGLTLATGTNYVAGILRTGSLASPSGVTYLGAPGFTPFIAAVQGGTINSNGAELMVRADASVDWIDIRSVVAGTGAFTKSGAGSVILSGSAANTYSGLTTIQGGGAFILNKPNGQVAIAGDILLGDGSTNTLQLGLGGGSNGLVNPIATTSVLTFAGSGASNLTLNGNNQTLAGIQLLSGSYNQTLQNGTANGYYASTLTVNNTQDYFTGSALRDGASAQYGNLKFVKQGPGRLIMGGYGASATVGTIANTGGIEVQGGVLQLINTFGGASNSTALAYTAAGATPASGGAGYISVSYGATLDLNGQDAAFDYLTGAGVVTNLGTSARTLALGTLDNVNMATGAAVAATWSGVISDGPNGGALAVQKRGAGTQTFTVAQNFTSGLYLLGGTLVLDLSGMANPNNLIRPSNALYLEGNLTVKAAASGTSSQAFYGAPSVMAGATEILGNANGGGGLTVDLATLTRSSVGATINFTGATGVTYKTGGLAATPVGWATYVGTGALDWAVTSSGAVVAYSGYTVGLPAATGAAATNYSDTSTGVTLTAGVALNSLKLAPATTAQTIALGANALTFTTVATTGPAGLLFDGANAAATITGSAAAGLTTVASTGNELVVYAGHSAGAGNTLTIGAIIGGSLVNLTKAGPDLVDLLSTANTFTGTLRVNEGTVRFGSVAATGTAQPLGKGGVIVGGGAKTATLDYSGTTATTWSQSVGLGDGGVGQFMLSNAAVATLTVGGVISGAGSLTVLTPTTAGSGLILGGTNTYLGQTIIQSGAKVSLSNSAGLGAGGTLTSGTVVQSGGVLDLQDNKTLTTEILTISGTGIGGTGAVTYSGATTDLSNQFKYVILAGNATIGGTGTTVKQIGINGGFVKGNGYNLTLNDTNFAWLVNLVVDNVPVLTQSNGGLVVQQMTLGGGAGQTLVMGAAKELQLRGANIDRALTLAVTGATITAYNSNAGADDVISQNITQTVSGSSVTLRSLTNSTLVISGNLLGTGAAGFSRTGGSVVFQGSANTGTGTIALGSTANNTAAGVTRIQPIYAGNLANPFQGANAVSFIPNGSTNLGAAAPIFYESLILDNARTTGTLSQAFGVLTAGATVAANVQLANATGQSLALTFSSLTRQVGGELILGMVGAYAVPSATNRIDITGFTADQGVFFGPDSYAIRDAGNFLRPVNYATDAGANAVTGSAAAFANVGAATNHSQVQAGGAVTAQGTATIGTLALGAGSSVTLSSGATLTLGVAGVLKSGGGSATISGGTALQLGVASSTDAVIRVSDVSDALTIATPLAFFDATTQSLSKFGQGRLTLSGASSLTGTLNIQEGTLRLAGTNAFGTLAANTITVGNGAALELSGGVTLPNNLTVGVSFNDSMGWMRQATGSLRNIADSNTVGTVSSAGYNRINSDAGTLTITSLTNSAATSLGGAGNIVILAQSGTPDLAHDGTGTLTLRPSASMGLAGKTFSANGGSLVLDFTSMATPTNVVSNTALFLTTGGSVSLLGKSAGSSAQTFASYTQNGGITRFSVNPNGGAGTTLTLGGYTLSASTTSTANLVYYGTADFLPATGATYSVTAGGAATNVNGIMSGAAATNGFATAGSDWAVLNGTSIVNFAANGGVYVDLPATGAVATANYRLTASQTVTATQPFNSLKVDTSAGAVTLTVGAGQALTGNAILLVGSNDLTLSGGTIGAPTVSNYVHIQGSGNLNLNSTLADISGTDLRAWVFAGTGSGGVNIGATGSIVFASGSNNDSLLFEGGLPGASRQVTNAGSISFGSKGAFAIGVVGNDSVVFTNTGAISQTAGTFQVGYMGSAYGKYVQSGSASSFASSVPALFAYNALSNTTSGSTSGSAGFDLQGGTFAVGGTSGAGSYLIFGGVGPFTGTQSGGALTVNRPGNLAFFFGQDGAFGASATYQMTGGSFSVNGASVIGGRNGGTGTFTVSGASASLFFGQGMVLGLQDFAQGTFNQNAGTVTIGTGVNISDSSWVRGDNVIGLSLAYNQTSNIGLPSLTKGTYNLAGGELRVNLIATGQGNGFVGAFAAPNTFTDAASVYTTTTGGTATFNWGAATLRPFDSELTIGAGIKVALTAAGATLNTNDVSGIGRFVAFDSAVTGAYGLTQTGNGVMQFNVAATYAGDTAVNAGTFRQGVANALPSGAAAGNLVLNSGASFAGTFDLNGFAATLNGLSGDALAAVRGQVVNNGSGAATLTVGANGATSTFNGLLRDNSNSGAGTLALTKTGSGTLTLGGASTYTGATTVSAGTLAINGSLAAGSAVSVASGAKLAGAGTVAGAVTVASGATIVAGASGASNLTLSGGLTLAGTATINTSALALGAGSGAAYLSVGALTANGAAGSVVLNVTSGSNYANNASYPLLTYTGAIGGTGSSAFVAGTISGLTGRQSSGLDFSTAGVINLLVTGVSPIWTGYDVGAGSASNAWTEQTLGSWSRTNWYTGTAGSPTATGVSVADAVLFDDSVLTVGATLGGSSPTSPVTVDISDGNVTPSSVVFANSAVNYVLTGANGIAGATSLVKGGTGKLTINTANSFTGGINLNAGEIVVGNASALGATSNVVAFGAASNAFLTLANLSVTLGGLTGDATATVRNGGSTADSVLTVGGSATTVFGGALVDGSGTAKLGLATSGTATLVLAGANTYTGDTTVGAGSTLQVGNGGTTGSLGATTIAVASGGALAFKRSNSVAFPGAVTGAGSVNILSGTLVLTGSFASGVTNTVASGATLQVGDATTNGSLGNVTNNGTLSFSNNGTTQTYSGTVTGTGGVNFAAGTVLLSGSLANTGSNVISSGATLQIGDGSANVSFSGTVTDNGTLAFNLNATPYTYGAAVSGTGSLAVTAGTLILTTGSSYAGGTTIASGATLQLGNNGTGGSVVGNVATDGTLVINRGPLTTSTASFNGNITGTGGLTLAGSGIVTFGGTASTFSGATTIGKGTFKAGAANVLSPNSALVIGAVGTTGTLDLNGFAQTALSLAAAGTVANQSVTNNSASSDAVLTLTGTGAYAGKLTNGASKKLGLALANGAVLTFSGAATASTYTGATAVQNGTLRFASATAGFANSLVVLGGNGTNGAIDVNGIGGSVGGLGPVDASAVAANQLVGNSGSVPAALTLTVPAATTATFNGVIQDVLGAGTSTTGLNVTNNATGIQVLTAASTYTGGTTLTSGTLQVGAAGTTGAIGPGPVVLAGGNLLFNRTDGYTLDAANIVTGSAGALVIGRASLTVPSDAVLNMSAGASLMFGASAGSTTVASLNLNGFGGTIGILASQTNAVAASTIVVPAGKTLTALGGIALGYDAGSGTPTKSNVTLSGAGTFAVTGGTVNLSKDLAVTNSAWVSTAILDLTGLAAFTANVTSFNVGVGSTSSGQGVLLLSNTANTIVATTLSAGDSGGNNGPGVVSSVTLGAGTNVLQVDTLNVGRGKSSAPGLLQFASQTSGSAGTLTLTNKAGNGGATINVADAAGVSTAGNATGTLDLRGHVVNVTAAALNIGRNDNPGLAGSTGGVVYFDTGVFLATSVGVGVKTAAGTGAGIGTLNLSGGSFTVASGGSFTLGSQATAGTSQATLNLTGGTLTSNVSILNGGGSTTSTLTLNGGTLDLVGGANTIGSASASVSLTLAAGTLRNVSQINNGAALSKTTAGTLILDGTNGFSGTLTISAGTVQVGAGGATGTPGSGNIVNSSALAFNRSGALTVANLVSGAGTLAFSGGGVFTLSGANTFTGVTTINAGTTVSVTTLGNGGVASGNLGSATNAAANLVLNGGVLQYAGATASTDRSFTVGTAGATFDAAGSAGTFTLTGAATLAGTNTARTITLANSAGAQAGVYGTALADNGTGATSVAKTGAGTWTLNAANTFTGATTVTGGTLAGVAGAFAGTSGISLTGGSLTAVNINAAATLSLDASSTATISGAGLTLAGAVTNDGSATNALNFTANTGTITLASLAGAGRTTFGSSATITGGVAAGTVTVAGLLTANVTGGTVVADSITGAVSGAAAVTITGTATSLVSGTLTLGDSAVAITTLTGGNVVLGNGALTVNAGTQTGVISGSAGSLVKAGAGELVLQGANTYTGATTVSAGKLTVSSLGDGVAASSLGASALVPANLVLATGATLGYVGVGETSARGFTMSSGATLDASGTGALVISSSAKVAFANSTSTRSLTLGGTSVAANTFGADLSVGGTLDADKINQLVKNGVGTWILANGATLKSTAEIDVNGGVLGLGAGVLPASGSVVLASGSTLRFESGNSDDVSGRLHFASGASATVSLANDVTFASALTVDGVSAATFVKSGAGKLTLAAANTNVAVTVAQGAINVTNASGLGSGATTVNGGRLAVNAAVTNAVTVNNGGVVGGSGSVGSLNVGGGATLSPGNSPGTLTAGNAALFGGSIFEWQVQDVSNVAKYDHFDVTGTLDLSGASSSNRIVFKVVSLLGAGDGATLGNPLNFDAPFGAAPAAQRIKTFNLGTVGSVNLGANANINDVFTFDVSQFTYSDGSASNAGLWSIAWDSANHLVTVTAVPEPSTYGFGLGALALAAAAIRRRRKNQPTKA